MTIDQKYMQRAISLAKRGMGWVNPNPMVGAVLVRMDLSSEKVFMNISVDHMPR